MNAETRQEPAKTLQQMDVHASWSLKFRIPENDRFSRLAFDYLATVFGEPGSTPVVDAGCGSGTKTILLAQRGYHVTALDFSNVIIDQARKAVAVDGCHAMVEFAQADLTDLNLPNGSKPRILCWGVLMHIPSVENAVGELARVLAPGGVLVVSEGNLRSVQAVALRWLKRLLRKERAELICAPAGLEQWERSSAGRLLTRQADIPWLIAEFERHGLVLQERRAGQFTEIYTLLPWRPIRLAVHAFNNAWFRWIRAGGPSFGNLLVFRKPD